MTKKDDCLSDIIQKRHSGREYAKKEIEKNVLLRLIEAARLSPSCYNEQPWHYLITTKKETPEAFAKLADCLADANRDWAEHAPCLILITGDMQFSRNQKHNRWGLYDAGASAMSLMYEATALGLMSHQMGGFDEEKARREFSIPEQYTPISVMAVGYEENPQEKPAKKERKPIDKNFFYGSWGTGVS